MNTLPRAVTARFFPSSTEYLALRRHWSALVNSERRYALTAAHHTLYMALLGRNWRKGFTRPTNSKKVANGAFENWGLFHMLRQLHSTVYEGALLEPFAGLVAPELLSHVRKLIPWSLAYRYKQADYAEGRFPFDAYTVPADWLAVSREGQRDA